MAIDVIVNDKQDAADILLASTSEGGFSRQELVDLMSDPSVKFTTTPENVMKYAEFMHDIGSIKQRPASWKDLFFPELHDSHRKLMSLLTVEGSDPRISQRQQVVHRGATGQLPGFTIRSIHHSRAVRVRKIHDPEGRGRLYPADAGPYRVKRGRRNCAPGPDRVFVFQEFDQLLPWKTVKENIVFALTASGKLPARRPRRNAP